MKLLEIIKKEVSIVKSQRIAMVLIILYPLLAISLLGLGLTGTSTELFSTAKIGVFDDLPYDLNIQKEVFGEKSDIVLIFFEDVNSLVDAVKRKEIVVGLGLSARDKKSQIIIDLYYDNSNLAAGTMFKEFAKITMSSFAINQTRTQLNNVWFVISELGKNLESEVNQINEFKQKLVDAEKTLDDLENKLEQINFDEIEQELDGQKQSIESFEQKSKNFEKDLQSFKKSFEELKEIIEQINDLFTKYSNEVFFVSNQLDLVIENIDLVLENDLDEVSKGILLSQKESLLESKTKIDFLKDSLNKLNQNNSTHNLKIREADLLFKNLEKELVLVSENLKDSSQTIDNMNSRLIVFKESIEEVRIMIFEARKARIEILEKLDSSSNLLEEFSEEIIEFSEIDTSVLAQPIRVFEKRVFQPTTLPTAIILIDPLIISGITANALSIVLILTCLLLTSIIVILERTEKVSLRMFLSSTNKFVFLIGKIIGQLLIALLEATIIFLVVILIFGLNILPNLFIIYLATALISLAFISMGLLISSFTKSQSTAILLSLLIVVPMLFLSGIILPLELMNFTMQIVSNLLPLTAANNLLVGLIVKDLLITDLLFEVMVLFAIILLGILTFMLKENY